jgi:hypothetical protein
LHPIDQQHTKDLTNTHIRRTPFSAVLARGTNPQQPDYLPPEQKVNVCKPLYNKDFDAASTFGQKFCRRGRRRRPTAIKAVRYRLTGRVGGGIMTLLCQGCAVRCAVDHPAT